MVTAGRQSLSSSSNDRHTVPDGYTFGWNIGGSNLPAQQTKPHFINKSCVIILYGFIINGGWCLKITHLFCQYNLSRHFLAKKITKILQGAL